MDDRERKHHLEKLKVRAEMRSADELENSAVIAERAESRAPKSSSTPAPARGLVAVLNTLPPWGRVIVLVMLGALVGSGAFGALADKLGWFR